MKFQRLFLLFALLVPAVVLARPVKVACVGNSITFGYTIPEREKYSYPSQLQLLLGPGYEVANFGVPRMTALFSGDYPYVNTEAYRKSLEFNPDIVLLKLGTNDSKAVNWDKKENFAPDYQKIIDSYAALPSRPRIILIYPLRSYLEETGAISDSVMVNEMRPMVEALARKNKTGLIDFYGLFGPEWDARYVPDKIHPSAVGAAMMARRIADYLLSVAPDGSQPETPLCCRPASQAILESAKSCRHDAALR